MVSIATVHDDEKNEIVNSLFKPIHGVTGLLLYGMIFLNHAPSH